MGTPWTRPELKAWETGRRRVSEQLAGLNCSTAGFTLVEVVVAILILAVVMLGVTSMLYVSWLHTQRGGSSTVAMNLAQAILEEIKSDPSQAVPVLEQEFPPEDFPDAAGYTYSVATDDDDDLVTVTVTVYFEVNGIGQHVALTALVSKT